MNVSSTQENRFAWMILSLLFAGSVLSYMDRATLGMVIPQVRRELSLTNFDYGLSVDAFLLTYMIFYVLGGRIADVLGLRRTFSLNVICWSVVCALHALVQGLVSLCLLRALLGVSEGGFYPTAMRGVADWFRTENRSKGVGVILCGVTVGTLLTPPIVAGVTLHYGWRASFVVTGGFGLLLVPVWVLLNRRIRQAYGRVDPVPAWQAEGESQGDGPGDISLGSVLKRRKYWMVLATRSATDTVGYFYIFWMPAYFQDIRRFDLAMIGTWFWIPYFCGGVGALVGAWASSALIKRGMGLDRSRKIVLVLSALLTASGVGIYYVWGRFLALGLYSLVLFGNFVWSTNLHTAITEIAPRRHVAVLYGMTGASGTLMGVISQPLIGHLVDRVGYGPAFVGASIGFLVAIGLLFGVGKIERIRPVEVDLAQIQPIS